MHAAVTVMAAVRVDAVPQLLTISAQKVVLAAIGGEVIVCPTPAGCDLSGGAPRYHVTVAALPKNETVSVTVPPAVTVWSCGSAMIEGGVQPPTTLIVIVGLSA